MCVSGLVPSGDVASIMITLPSLLPAAARICLLMVLSARVLAPSGVHAQPSPGFSFDGTIGRSWTGTDGEYREQGRSGLALDLTVARDLAPRHSVTWIGSVSASVYGGGWVYDAICMPAPSGGCLEGYTGMAVLSPGVGVRNASGSLRGSAGPGLALIQDRKGSLGLFGRVDGSVELTDTVRGVMSVRAGYVPDVGGDTFRVGAIAFGLRLH